jgi:tetratricopeptide (TPR) repeat protein
VSQSARVDSQRRQERSRALGAFAIVALTFLTYIPVFSAGFIWDDDAHVLHTPQQTSLRGLRDLWNPRLHAMPQYYPVTHTFFWIENQLWGTRPAGYHVINVALHATGAVLIWILLRRLNVPGAFLAAMLFAVHPVHVESVAWVSERKNTLSCALYLSAAMLYLRAIDVTHREERTSRDWVRYALATVLFIAAVLSKSVTCSLPAALLLVVWWKRGQITLRDVLPLIPWFVIGLIAGLNTASIERTSVGAAGGEWALSPPQRILIAGRAVCFYAAKLVVPWPLSFNYEKWNVDPHDAVQWLYPAGVIVVVATLGVLTWRRVIGRGPLVAVLFFIGTLVPALGFFNLYPMRFSYVADHFQYHASIGLLALLAAIVFRLIRNDRARVAVGSAVVVILMGTSFARAKAFHDAETLWSDTINKSPGAWMPYANLGQLLAERGEYPDAAGALAKSLELNPDQAEAHLILGDLLLKVGDDGRALTEYREAATRRPRNFRAHESIGKVLLARGDLPGARDEYQRAVELEPRFVEGRAKLAGILYKLGLTDAAIEQARAAVALLPDDATLHNNLGVYLEAAGQRDEALREYETAVTLRPDYAQPADAARRLRAQNGEQQ